MPIRSFKLTDGDIELLRFVYELRLATIDHVVALSGRERTRVNRRLVRLVEHGYLYRRRSTTVMKYVYTLNRHGAEILVEREFAPKELVDLRVRLGELTDMFLRHALSLSDIHTVLLLVSRLSSIKLIDWREGRQLYDSVSVRENDKDVRLVVRPDAYFSVQDTTRPKGRSVSDFFLEADRSTTTTKRFGRKIKAYSAYSQSGGLKERYGTKQARIITVTLTEARAESLCKATSLVVEGRGERFYYFTPMKFFTFEKPERILDPIFISPQTLKSGKYHYLIPSLAKNQCS